MDNLQQAESLEIDQHSRFQLAEAARWAKFVGIAGIIFGALLLLGGIFINVLMTGSPGTDMIMPMGSMKAIISVIYILGGVISCLLSFFLYRFGNQAATALGFNRQDYLAHSFKNLKMVYKMMGIIIISYIALTALGMVFSVFSGGGR